jgi:glycosyltransferase involved in cell wall biosynthesis
MLSICTTIKNRSRVETERGIKYLFPDCVKALAKSIPPGIDAELVITDWQSDDWLIESWIEEYIPNIPIHLVTVISDNFSVGKGRNIAANHAEGDILFFMDADMIVNQETIEYGIYVVNDGGVYYPKVHYELDDGRYIIHQGGGNLFLSKNVFNTTGGWPEFTQHGFEDTDFAQNLRKTIKHVSNDKISIFHPWHPQNKEFKNRYYCGDIKVEERREFYKAKEREPTNNLAKALEIMINNNPNTTHQSLKPPVKGIIR